MAGAAPREEARPRGPAELVPLLHEILGGEGALGVDVAQVGKERANDVDARELVVTLAETLHIVHGVRGRGRHCGLRRACCDGDETGK